MEPTPFTAFEEAEGADVLDLLQGLPPQIGRRGLQLLENRAVKRIWWEKAHRVLKAQVQGGKLYTQTIPFRRHGLGVARCSCPHGVECKHVAAALLAALEGWEEPAAPADQAFPNGLKTSPTPGAETTEFVATDDDAEDEDAYDFYAEEEDDDHEDEDGYEVDPPAPGNAREVAAAPPVSSPPAVLRNPAVVADPALSLAEFLALRTGKALSARDLRLVQGVEAVWRTGEAMIPEPDLLRLGGHTSYFYAWNSQAVALWPAQRPPQTATDAWHYVAHALREQKRLPSIPIYQTVDWTAVEALVAPWNRERHVAQWKREFQQLSRLPRGRPVSAVFRLQLSLQGAQIEWRIPGASEFVPIKSTALRQHASAALNDHARCDHALDDAARRFLVAILPSHDFPTFLRVGTEAFEEALGALLRQPGFGEVLVSPEGTPLVRVPAPLRWSFEGPVISPEVAASLAAAGADVELAGDYEAVLRTAEGREVPPSLATLPGWPTLFVTLEGIYEIHDAMSIPSQTPTRLLVPAAAVETEEGVEALESMHVDLPERLARRVEVVPLAVTVRCRLQAPAHGAAECFQVRGEATAGGRLPDERWSGMGWQPVTAVSGVADSSSPGAPIVRADRSLLLASGPWLDEAGVKRTEPGGRGGAWAERRLQGAALREFPEVFLDWLSRRPENITVELDPMLASLRDGNVSGSVKLDAEEAGVDWFDLRVSLDVSEVELTPAEIDLLLKAQGRWVRLPDKGWRRLEFNLSDDEHAQLADLGLGVGDLTGGEKHRLHVFQLAGAGAGRLLPPERAEQVRRRAEELRTAVNPGVPAAITASLRPYQLEGYHFLAYLSANRFGGILADDMGLGKTVQTLAWLAWMRDTGQLDGPALVICPKSVQDNWRGEVARFCPGLKVRVWTRDTAGSFEDPVPPPPGKPSRKKKPAPPPGDDLFIINYTQLRLHEEALIGRKWAAVILDEAQYIKNPSSQTTKAACALQAGHRLALSGTPIENRLLDLWSIMHFAMPGVLGHRAAFARTFNGKDDPLARRRLSARVRPFVLRRTKKEVAKDLPDRIEEEIVCDLEGPQATLYRAELKRARAMLLKAKTSSQLDKLRFNILTSLLRLRQICCHPALVGAGKPGDESAKLAALLDLLEPLVEEGHKVLVFSQFVEMLELIRAELAQRDWPHFLLTGQTEDRGALVDRFQQADGASVFLISLKAGGFGLNLTAASYVVLFDPWWNPAVENQAIDRTHRIGQVNKVIAYRLLVRETIEEKIRHLKKQKNALASDIFGEESFAKALTLDDFRFLLGDGAGEGAEPPVG